MNIKKRFSCIAMLLLAVLIVGCEKEKVRSRELTFSEMMPGDVLVSVNGKGLTKQEVADKLLRIYQNVLHQPGSNKNVAGQTVMRERGRLIDQFIARRILSDAATRQNLISKDKVKEIVTTNMTEFAKERGLTLKEYEWRERDMARYLRDMIEENVLIEAFIATNITPYLEITPELVSNYLATVDAENAIVAKTNEIRRAELLKIREECLKNPNCWMPLAEKISLEDSSEGEVEYDDFMTPATAEVVFTTPVGGITQPIEEEDGFRMVRVIGATAQGSTNSFGEVSARGTRTCSQIYIEKDPYFMKWSFEDTTKELEQQRTTARVDAFVEESKTNGTNVIEFPHGTDFWGVPRMKKTNHAKVPASAAAKDNSKEAAKSGDKGISKEQDTIKKDKENK